MKIGIAGPVLTDSLKEYLNLENNDYPKGLGGTAVNNIIIGILKAGFDVSVYTLDTEVKEKTILEGSHLKIFFGEYRKRGRSRMLDFFNKESKQITNFILEDKPDIVNAHWGYEYAIGAIKSSYPHLITLRDAPWEILKLKKDLYRLIRLLMNFWVIKKGKQFNVNSPYLKEKLGYLHKGFSIIPNPINDVYIIQNPKTFPDKEWKIVSILNGWGEIKNPIPALKAFAKLRNKLGDKVIYDFYGPDYELNGIAEKWAKNNDCVDGVRFLGNIEHEILMHKLREYDILIHPSKEESFGNTLIEGMAAGLPVIAGEKSGAVPWVLNDGENGILVDVTSMDKIYKVLQKIINNKSVYVGLSKKGIKFVKRKYSLRKITNQYLNLYKRILNI